jgi:hypothetical protein
VVFDAADVAAERSGIFSITAFDSLARRTEESRCCEAPFRNYSGIGNTSRLISDSLTNANHFRVVFIAARKLKARDRVRPLRLNAVKGNWRLPAGQSNGSGQNAVIRAIIARRAGRRVRPMR